MHGRSPVPLPRELTPGCVKVRRIKLVLGGRCELCGEEDSLESLEVHSISGGRFHPRDRENLEGEILVLCGPCHRDVHLAGVPRAEQGEILLRRPGKVRREIRQILGSRPKPYVPPESNIPEIFEEAIRINTYIFGV